MLDVIRQNTSHWLLKVILAVIALVFIFYFGQGPMGGDASTYAAKVNGKEIPIEQFQNLFESTLESRRNRQLPDELQERMITGQVLDQLIEAELLAQFAEEIDLHVSKVELAQRITELPFLLDETTNQFIGKDKYLAFLEERGIEVGEFEDGMRKDLLIDKARKFVEASVKVTPEEVKEEWLARNEKVNLQFLNIDATSLAESLKKEPVKDADIAAFEGKFPGLAEQLYAEEKEFRWTKPAVAKIQQITVRKPAPGKGDPESAKRRSERAMEMLATDWKKAAEQYSEGPAWEKSGDPREVARRELPSAVADKVFASAEAGSEPAIIETPTTFTIVKVLSVTPEKVTELDEKVKREIITEQVRSKRAEELVESFSQESFEKLKNGTSIEKIAASRGLAVKETGAFTVRQTLPGLSEADLALTNAAFKLETPGSVLGIDGKPPKVGDAYVLAVLKEHVKPNDADFETQKIWVESSLVKMRAAEAFRSWKADRVAEAKIVQNPQLLPST